MTGDNPRSSLADKAIALKAKRDAEAQQETKRAQAVAEREAAAVPRWGEIGRDLGAVVIAVNEELKPASTHVELRWDNPQLNLKRSRLARTMRPRNRVMTAIRGEIQSVATLTLNLDGRPLRGGTMTLTGYTRGDARVHDSASGENAHVDFHEMDRTWLDGRVRAFVDAVLTEED